MDRPEDVEVHPATGAVYAALTNNTQRGVAGSGQARPSTRPTRAPATGTATSSSSSRRATTRPATTFGWNLLLVCGPANTAGTYFGGYQGPVSPISCPDNVAFDSAGNLWISTDGQPGTIGSPTRCTRSP